MKRRRITLWIAKRCWGGGNNVWVKRIFVAGKHSTQLKMYLNRNFQPSGSLWCHIIANASWHHLGVFNQLNHFFLNFCTKKWTCFWLLSLIGGCFAAATWMPYRCLTEALMAREAGGTQPMQSSSGRQGHAPTALVTLQVNSGRQHRAKQPAHTATVHKHMHRFHLQNLVLWL